MAKPKPTTAIKPKTILKKPREIFKNELLERISMGEELQKREITSIDQLPQLNRDASDWHDYNKELIKRSFNNQDSEYFYEFSRLNYLTSKSQKGGKVNRLFSS